ncbi:unnamed protein product, partial [Callosobruchus maculatus]
SEVYAILQCARINNERSYRNKRIAILTDSQATLRALEVPKVTSALVWECLQELGRLAEHNKVTLEWVPGHSGIRGNERANELARLGSSALYIGAEPALGCLKAQSDTSLPTRHLSSKGSLQKAQAKQTDPPMGENEDG